MSQLKQRLQKLREANRKGLIVYLTAGCPDYETTLAAVLAAEKAGADVIEIGIPFSDPMADGPIIQKAAAMALKAGATTAATLNLIKAIRQHSSIPLVIMTYVNSVMQFGFERFATAFAQAGIDGLIIPDLPVEECSLVDKYCQQAGIDLIQFVAPTTTAERIGAICQKASGFLYCISSTGVTGVRKLDYSGIGAVMQSVRRCSSIPLAIGFGIGSAAAAVEAARYADCVIVGSAIMQQLMDNGVDAAANFTATIRQALDKGVVD